MAKKNGDTLRLVAADTSSENVVGQRLVDLRKATAGLGTQEAVLRAAADVAAALGYPVIDRIQLSKLENGALKLKHYETRAVLAGAFGLSTDDFSLYLDGKVTLAEVMLRKGSRRPSRPVICNAERPNWGALVAAAREEDPTLDESILRELAESPTYADSPLDARELADVAAAIMRHRARRKRGQGTP